MIRIVTTYQNKYVTDRPVRHGHHGGGGEANPPLQTYSHPLEKSVMYSSKLLDIV